MKDPKGRVLLVSDSNYDLAIIRAALTGMPNVEVVLCRSGQELFDYLPRHEVALIIMSLSVSLFNRLSLAAQIRSQGLASHATLIMILSATEKSAFLDQTVELETLDFIEKPLHIKVLRSRVSFFVKAYLQNKRLERRDSETAAQKTQKAQLLDLGLDAIIGTDSAHRIIYWNSRAHEVFGWSEAEALGRDVSSLILPARFREGHRVWVESFFVLSSGRLDRKMETLALTKSGEEFAAELTAAGSREAFGAIRYFVVRDRSEESWSRSAGEKQRATEQDLVANLETMTEGFMSLDPNYVVTYANHGAEAFLSLPKEQILGKTADELFPSPDLLKFKVHYDKIMETGQQAKFEESYLGQIVQVHAYRARNGGVSVFFHDVTEQRKIEQFARTESERLRLVANAIPDLIAYVGTDERYKFANAAYEEWVGLAPDEVVGKTIREVLGESYEHSRPYIQRILKGERVRFEASLPLAGKMHHLDARYIPDFSQDGKLRGFVVVAHDVTEIRESRDIMQTLSNSIPQLIWMADPDGSVFWCNNRWYEYTGMSLEQLKGQGWRKAHDPSALPNLLQAYNSAIESGEPGEFEILLRARTGEMRWYLLRWTPLKDKAGRVLRWFGAHTDVHEQRLLREDQRFRANLTSQLNSSKSVKDLAALATRALAAYLHASRCFLTEINHDLATVHTDFSSSLPSLQGTYDLRHFGPDMVRSWRSGKVIVVEDVTLDVRTASHASSHRELGIASFITIPLLREGELVAALNLSAENARAWSQREIELVQLVAEVIWSSFERVRLLEALQESSSRSNFLASASAVLNSSLDVEQILRTLASVSLEGFANFCMIHLLHQDGGLKELVIAHQDREKEKWACELLEIPALRQNLCNALGKILSSEKAKLLTEILPETLGASGLDEQQRSRLRCMGLKSCIAVPLRVRQKTLGVMTLVSTSTSLRRYEKWDLALAEELVSRASLAIDNAHLFREAKNLNRLKDEFLASLSHELRTPMSVIKGHAEILKDEADSLPPEVVLAVDAIYRNANAQSQIIADLLDVSSIITGKVSCDLVPISPLKLISEVLDGLRAPAEAKGVRLNFSPISWPEQAPADPTRLRQVLWNLVSNALKFTDSGGTVTISTSCNAKNWLITVSDTGIGIDPEFLPYVFDRFRQEDASNSRKFGGLGLGLSISKNLVELHGGTLQVESKGRGHGAQFTVRLPREPQSVPPPRPPPLLIEEGPPAIEGIKVLLVEDSDDNRSLVRKMLSRAGAEVVDTGGPAEARDRLQNFRPDVIVSDIGMPEEDGMKFIRNLRSSESRELCQIPAVALTAYARQEEKEEIFKAGFQAHVAKPVSLAKLVAAVKAVLSRP